MERIDILEELARIGEIEYQLGIVKRRLQRWLFEGEGEGSGEEEELELGVVVEGEGEDITQVV